MSQFALDFIHEYFALCQISFLTKSITLNVFLLILRNDKQKKRPHQSDASVIYHEQG